ncbi:hypothetical protein [Halorubellus salinus]|uniref:hypothetical protein n=1 Tax=Halorubellus salinus TaxID=755309 RepID=UPI001D078672|nr:hypothetical protein [Halorubellus salinus]
MKRTLLLCCVVAMVALAGCSGGGGDDAAAATSDPSGDDAPAGGGTDDGDTGDDSAGGDAGADGDGGEAAVDRPEIAMLEFDRSERYEYQTYAYGENATTVVDVVVDGDDAELTISHTSDARDVTNTFAASANDPESVIDVLSENMDQGGVVFVAQSQDVSGIFVQNDVPFELGAEFENEVGNVTVTGRDTIGGVECLTYDFYFGDELVETGCLSPELEIPVQWAKADGDGGVRMSIEFVSYETGDARFVGHSISTIDG